MFLQTYNNHEQEFINAIESIQEPVTMEKIIETVDQITKATSYGLLRKGSNYEAGIYVMDHQAIYQLNLKRANFRDLNDGFFAIYAKSYPQHSSLVLRDL